MTTRNFRVKNGISVGDITISASANTITGLATAAPSADGDVANKKYVDDSLTTTAFTMASKTLTSPVLNGTLSGTAFLDEDNMASDSAIAAASQQSIKAYVDAQDANIASDTLTFTNKTIDANGTGNSISNIEVADLAAGVLDTDLSSVSASDDTLASAKAIKAYVDSSISTAENADTTITVGNTSAVVSDTGSDGAFTVTADGNTELVVNDTSATFSGNVIVSGNFTVNGTTTTVATTNTVVSDSLMELANGTTGAPANDAGIVIERGDQNNAFIGYDESEDKFKMGTGTFTGASTGNLTITTGTLIANIEGNLTGTATAAQYSDVAERFAADTTYEPGTVVALGGAEEITAVNEEASDEVFGVVSSLDQAAFKMNGGAGTDETHPYIAMTGRVNVKVIGTVNKGDRLISASVPGYARAATKAECTAFNVIGRALTNKDVAGPGSVLAAVRVSH